MANNKTFKCPFCSLKYVHKPSLYTHMEKEHKEQLDGLTPAHVYFNFKNKKDHGECIICHNETKFNEQTERYDRLCDNPKCKETYREQFKKRMQKKYGKVTLLNDPEQQKKMLEKRKISGEYTWSKPPHTKIKYTGTYEKEFLEFLDIFMNWETKDIFAPSPIIFKYKYNNKDHFYIPDFYLASLNLIIEVKSYNNKHYRERDINIEKIKDKVVLNDKGNYNYIKVHDKNYDDFFNELIELRNNN